jgi:hypothetical protein
VIIVFIIALNRNTNNKLLKQPKAREESIYGNYCLTIDFTIILPQKSDSFVTMHGRRNGQKARLEQESRVRKGGLDGGRRNIRTTKN